MQEIFTKIYGGKYKGDQHCGPGSTLWYTESLRKNLPDFLKKWKIQSMFDAPCGDFNWMRMIHKDLPCSYLGGEIVQKLVDRNKAEYPQASFIQCDIAQDRLPKVDLFFCRECLFHLSNQDKARVLANFVKSEIKYLLTTHHLPYDKPNLDTYTGGFAMINWFNPPWSFPQPLDNIDDSHPRKAKRQMSLWSREQIAKEL